MFRISEQKNYEVGDEAEYDRETAEIMITEGYLSGGKRLVAEISGEKLKGILENTKKPKK